MTVLLGNGSGEFSIAPGSPLALGAGTSPRYLAVGDFNGDGIQDLVTADQSSNTVTLLLGNGSGGFTAGSPVPVGSVPVSVAVGDFNGDGLADIATANQSDNTVKVLLGNGSRGFTPAMGSPYPVGTGQTSVVVGDFNGDGIPDLATANQNTGSNNVTVLLGNGGGGFTVSAVAVGGGAVPYSAGSCGLQRGWHS